MENEEQNDFRLEGTGFAYTLSLINGKYKMPILYYLSKREVVRYNEMKRYLGKVTFKTLTDSLKALEEDGLVNRKEYPQVPPKVEYSLTEKVRSLIPRDRPRQYSIAKQAAEPPALDMLPQIAYCSSLPLNHSLKLSIPVTIYLPPQFIQHFFYCFFNPFICIFSQCQCQRKLIYNVSRGQFSWIVSPHLYGHLHLRILQAIGHNIFPLRDSFCRITSDIR